MKAFQSLFRRLDNTTKTSLKEQALQAFFDDADDDVVIHGIHALLGKRDDAPASTSQMKDALKQVIDIDDWMYRRCYEEVGDTAETISLLLPVGRESSERSIVDWYRELRRLDRAKNYQKPVILRGWYRTCPPDTVFLVNKLITGGFRVGVSEKTVVNALSAYTGVDEDVLLHRLIGDWEPTTTFYESLCSEPDESELSRKPYPFCLCYPVDDPEDELGDADEYVFEWKYDGIRAQLLKRDEPLLWSRGGEPLNETFPELIDAAHGLEDDLVLDGEILAYDDEPLPFQSLQRRLGRRDPSQSLRSEVPVVFIVYDVMERDEEDLRRHPLHQRRAQLEQVDLPDSIRRAEQQWFSDWASASRALDGSRSHDVEGFMVKHVKSVYHSGRKKQGWWKWKLDPFALDAVLMYAQTGHGERSGMYTDYTFGVWGDDEELLPIAKAYSGLTDDEVEELDKWIRGNTVDQFGPVREVKKEQVFEIAFQGIYENEKKKSGFATRFPRMVRWRKTKDVDEADRIQRCQELVDEYG